MITLPELEIIHVHAYAFEKDDQLWPIVQLHNKSCEVIEIPHWDLSIRGEVKVSLLDLVMAVSH